MGMTGVAHKKASLAPLKQVLKDTCVVDSGSCMCVGWKNLRRSIPQYDRLVCSCLTSLN